MSTRIVAVFGATGTQGAATAIPIFHFTETPIGSSVVKALLSDGTFTPRAVTRDVNSKKALRLKQQGAEVVQADVWDVPSLKTAMTGAEAVFAVTAFADQANLREGPTSEVVMGKNMVDAAVAAGVQFFVWSSLPNTTKATDGKYQHIYHFDNKANVEDYLRSTRLAHANLHTGWFIENTTNYNCLTLAADSSSYELTIPKCNRNSPQYFTWVERDLGQCALALFKHYKDDSAKILGQTFYAVSDKMSYADYANEIEKAIRKPVRFVTGSATGVAELDEMYDYQSEFGFYPNATIPDPRLERLGVEFHPNKLFAEEVLKQIFA